MADFKEAHQFVAKWEGIYSNDPDDSGGETVYGISRVHHPNWVGWALVDAGDKGSEALKLVADSLYQQKFWIPLSLELINDQRLATVIYQAAVNCGASQAAKWLQMALRAYGSDLVVDGEIGNRTLDAVREKEQKGWTQEIIEAFLVHQRARYYALAAAGKTKFLKGWLNRVDDC